MYSATRRIKTTKQPGAGYVKPKNFTTIELNDGVELFTKESIYSGLVGL